MCSLHSKQCGRCPNRSPCVTKLRTGLKPQNGLFQQSAHIGWASSSEAAAMARTVGWRTHVGDRQIANVPELEDRISRRIQQARVVAGEDASVDVVGDLAGAGAAGRLDVDDAGIVGGEDLGQEDRRRALRDVGRRADSAPGCSRAPAGRSRDTPRRCSRSSSRSSRSKPTGIERPQMDGPHARASRTRRRPRATPRGSAASSVSSASTCHCAGRGRARRSGG